MVMLSQVEAELKSGFSIPDWVVEVSRYAEQCGWLNERNMERTGAMAHHFYFRSGKWVSIICKSNGYAKVENWNPEKATIIVAPDSLNWISHVKPLFS